MALPFRRRCKATVLTTGEGCRQNPLRDKDFCFWHDPESEEAAKEARRTGGLRRRRESTLAGAYEFDGIESEGGLARLLNIAAYDALALDTGVNKVRSIVAIVQAGERVLHNQELEARVAELESLMGDRPKKGGTR